MDCGQVLTEHKFWQVVAGQEHFDRLHERHSHPIVLQVLFKHGAYLFQELLLLRNAVRLLLHMREVREEALGACFERGLSQAARAGDQTFDEAERVVRRVEERLDVLKHKVSVSPRQVADSLIILYCFQCPAIVHLVRLLGEESSQSVLLCKLAYLRACKLKEDLEVSTCHFSCLVDLLNQLLHECAHISLKEGSFVCL